MDPQKLFIQLESNNLHESEEAKKRLTENFSATKEPWLVQGMMDYFLQTNSIRIVDVLIKVQPPHEKHLFDRLAEWVRGSQKNQALTLFGHIVRKHPTWLHKVVQHSLMKEVLKLLKTEKEIIPLMSALLCIIVLLPIIPSLMSAFFQDLFEAFSHLASWNCMNPSKLSHDLLVHLQIGLYTLFHRLYGMYPCNFIAFLRLEYINKENAAVFTHTIKPLLESVKMHPLLVSSNEKAEVNATRWKKKEPHDVVVECARFTLDNVEKHQETNADCCCHMKPFDFSPGIMETAQSPALSSLHKEKLMDYTRYGNIWSPSDVVLATPPPVNNSSGNNTVPHTPTPNIPSYSKTPITSGGHISGSSPPEAAIEATPETTPMKDHSLKQNVRTFPASNACRSMWKAQNVSQPSSPLKKETSPFGFPDPKSDSPTVATSQKLLRLVNDRNQLFHQNSTPSSPNPINEHSPDILLNRKNQMSFDSPIVAANTSLDSNHDEQESTTEQNNSGNHENEDFETEGSPCSAGGLHIPDSRSMMDFARRRFRMYSHCVPDTNYYCSAGTSPAETNTGSFMKISATAKLKRSNSWPELKRFKSSLLQTETKKIVNSKEFVKQFQPTKEICSSSTQTIQQWPEFYEHMFLGIFSEENKFKAAEQSGELPNRIPQPSDDILHSYIALSIKKRPTGNQRQSEESLRDQIQLLALQLQYERHRREIHAERNRRLLGKSRSNRSIESHNSTLRDQVNRLSIEISTLNTDLNSLRKKFNSKEQEYLNESNSWKIKYQNEIEENKMLRTNIETLQIRLAEESKAKKLMNTEVQNVSGELFDLRNDMQQATYQANLGQQYREELTNLQKEMILLGEIQIKCREKLAELNSLKARDAELDFLQQSYKEEIIEVKSSLDIKSSQLDTARARLSELEMQLSRRDQMFSEQKRLLKAVKEEYQEKFNALELKYTAQKAIILRMEERIMELLKYQPAVNLGKMSPESEKNDMVGSLDHTSPLSISLASSEGLSASLRSVTEIRNLEALVVSPSRLTNLHHPSSTITSAANTSARNVTISEEIPVPPGTSQQYHKRF